MSEKIKAYFEHSAKVGTYLPLAYDRGLPSVTLWFLYLSNALAILSLVLLHFKSDAIIASATTIIYAVICSVLYLMRRIQKFKADLDDKSIELEGEDDEPASETSSST